MMFFKQCYPAWYERVGSPPDLGECSSFREFMHKNWVRNREHIPSFKGWRQAMVKEGIHALIGVFEILGSLNFVCVATVWGPESDPIKDFLAYDKDEVLAQEPVKQKRVRKTKGAANA